MSKSPSQKPAVPDTGRAGGSAASVDPRLPAFSALGLRLSAAQTAKEAAQIIVEVADQLLGWDACLLDLYSPAEDILIHVLNTDTVDGRRAEFAPRHNRRPPTPLARRAIESGGQLVLKEDPSRMRPEALPFGNLDRPSASIMFVPIRKGAEVIGILSIQSYTPEAYDAQSLETLQALADHCGGALERIRGAEALRESSQFTEQMIASSQEGIIVYDHGLKYQVWNPFMERLTGYSAQEVLGKHPLEVFPILEERGVIDNLKKVLAGEPGKLTEFLYVSPRTGRSRWVADSNAPLQNVKGEIIGVIGTVRDISERKVSQVRVAALSELGRKLSAAQTAREAVQIILPVAEQLVGFDACTLDFYSAEKDRLSHVLNLDTIDGRRVDCPQVYHDEPPTPRMRHAIEQGAQLILRDHPGALSPDAKPFGNTSRPSAAMMFVPLRDGAKVIGVVSLHSYTPRAYDQGSLETLQMVADHCAGALGRIRAQEALCESEANYRALVERSPDATFVHTEGRVVFANPATLRLLRGERIEQLLGREVCELVPPENQALIRQRIQSAARGETTPLLEQKVLRLDGTTVEVEVTSLPFAYQGKPAVQTVMREITERKQAEARLAAFSALGHELSAAQTAKAAAQIVVEVADQLIGWDACTCALYSPAEDLLLHLLDMDLLEGQRTECSPAFESLPPSPTARRAIAEGGQLLLREQPNCPRPDSLTFGNPALRSASLMFVPIRNGTTVIGILSIQSYTPNAYDQRSLETLQALADHCGGSLDRIKTEEALRSSRARLQLQFDHMPLACITWDREHRVTSWNPAAERIFGFTASEALGKHPHEFLVPRKDQPLVDSIGQHLLEGGTDLHTVNEDLTRDGRIICCDWTSVPLRSADGGIVGVLSMVQDVTESRKLEAQLRQSQKMEAIGQLAGGVAHDFNNLLAVIRGNTELVLLDTEGSGGRTKDSLNQVVAAADRAASLTRQLLAFSRKQVMQTQSLNLAEVVGNLTKMLKRIIGEHINLQVRYAGRLPFVKADVGMVEQVLVNLVVNARDAMPNGGQLVIATEPGSFAGAERLDHPEARPGEFVCLSVTDTGTGIAPEHLPHLFEPFFTTKELGKGTGLGLATVYGIVKQHEGWVEVSSQPGSGATFKIFLPACPPPTSVPASPEAAPPLPGGTETILLVEDEISVRQITRRVLEVHGYKVYEAQSAPEALVAWESHGEDVALLLSDMVMPEGVNGRELAEQLRALRPELKVIFLSGYSADVIGKDTDFIQRCGGNFLHKPTSARTLLEAVRRCLDAK